MLIFQGVKDGKLVHRASIGPSTLINRMVFMPKMLAAMTPAQQIKTAWRAQMLVIKRWWGRSSD